MYNNKPIPHDYVDNFMKAFLTFRFQRVYCPSRKQCVEINNMDILSLSIDKLE